MAKVIGGVIMTVVGIVMIVLANTLSFVRQVMTPVENPFGGSFALPDIEINYAAKYGVLGGGIVLTVIGLIILIPGIISLAKKP